MQRVVDRLSVGVLETGEDVSDCLQRRDAQSHVNLGRSGAHLESWDRLIAARVLPVSADE